VADARVGDHDVAAPKLIRRLRDRAGDVGVIGHIQLADLHLLRRRSGRDFAANLLQQLEPPGGQEQVVSTYSQLERQRPADP
jgi:hypothetical protein